MKNSQVESLMAGVIPKGQLSEAQVSAWLQEIDQMKGKEKSWRQEAGKIVAMYEGYKRDAAPFNILFSNTDTLLPALYNNTPRPAVGRRFKDKDPLGAAASLVMNRTLTYSMDSNSADVQEFDVLVEHAILQALVPGRGVVRYKYEADIEEIKGVAGTLARTPKTIPDTTAEQDASQELVEGEEAPQPIPAVTNERVCGETVEYDRFLCGYAKKWTQVPWVSFEHHMTEEELIENFGQEVGSKVVTTKLEEDDSNEKTEGKDSRKVAVVYELWNKQDKTVIFLSPGMKSRELKLAEDPLGVSGFFPMDEPLHFLAKISSRIPQPIYNLYREQAEELNIVTRRITAVMQCIKVRGAYDSTVSEMSSILTADDGILVPVENIQGLGDGKGLKDAIFLMPLAELVGVLQQLYLQRTQIKTVIYEITGISDILRGSSVASETATAQQIKNQWGTLRLKKMQKMVAKWCRNNVRIMGEIAAKKFSQQTFQKMTGLPYITQEQKAQAQLGMQQFQMQAQQPAMPGQPPAPPQQPPQELVDALATPVWEEIVALMRDTVGMEFRVDIETNSTIADDMAEDQKNVGELLNALSQFLNGVAPLIENGAMPFEVAKSIMLGIVRKMAMGPEIEDQLDKMKAPTPKEPEKAPEPPPPQPDPNIELKQKAEAQSLQLQMQKLQQEGELAMQEHRNKMELEQQKALVQKAKFEQQLALAQSKATQQTQPPAGAQNANV